MLCFQNFPVGCLSVSANFFFGREMEESGSVLRINLAVAAKLFEIIK